MAALADYLDPGVQEINYWGVSYGTLLGFTFVNSEYALQKLRDVPLTMESPQCSRNVSVMSFSMAASVSAVYSAARTLPDLHRPPALLYQASAGGEQFFPLARALVCSLNFSTIPTI